MADRKGKGPGSFPRSTWPHTEVRKKGRKKGGPVDFFMAAVKQGGGGGKERRKEKREKGVSMLRINGAVLARGMGGKGGDALPNLPGHIPE